MKKSGIRNTINIILASLGYAEENTYVASNLWELQNGSVQITIAYNKDTGFIFGDAILCSLSDEPSNKLLTFLLSQNNEPDRIRLSVRNRMIVLSWTAYDKYFSLETGGAIIKEHLAKADYLDDFLVKEHGCTWPIKDD